ncbi:MAG: hypothetical protein JSW54_04565, partial [Fidelibacterota bacterium]
QTVKGRFMNAISPEWKYREAEPDILINDEYDLSSYGIGGRIVPTPGHTQGSLTIILDTGEMLVGDLVRGKPSNINLGMFYEDREVLVHSLADLVTRPSSWIYMSHGGQIDHALFKKAVQNLSEKE